MVLRKWPSVDRTRSTLQLITVTDSPAVRKENDVSYQLPFDKVIDICPA